MRIGLFIRNLARFKTVFLIVLFLIIIPSVSIADEEPVVEPVEKTVIVGNGGHRLHGMRGGVVLDFDSPCPDGLGYTGEEVIRNLQQFFGVD